MRARLVLLAVLSLFALGHARADDFDDDFALKDAAPTTSPAPAPQPALEAAAPKRFADPHNTLLGPVGGVHLVDASSGEPGTFRSAISGQFFRQNGFLVPADEHRRVGGALSLSATPFEHLELSAALTTASNESNESNDGERQVFQVIGDAHLFAKSYLALLPALTVGGDVELALLNGVGGIGFSAPGTSVGLRGNVSSDLRNLERPIPLILRFGLRYYFDNSARLIEDTEGARYASLNDAAPRDDEARHLVSSVERFAFQVNRVDMLTPGLGLEVPLVLADRVALHPLAEWSLGIPSNRQGYDCVVTQNASDRDSCLKDEGVAAWPRTFTIGVRILPFLRGLSVLLALDLATGGHKRQVRELAPNAAYDLLFSLGYAYDTRQAPARVVEKTLVVTREPERLGRILGEVVDAETGLGVPQAIVHFAGTELSDLAADAQGKFTSYPLQRGSHTLRISASGYTAADCEASLDTEGADKVARCELTAIPKRGNLRGTVHSEMDLPIASATVRISGPTESVLTTVTDGTFEQVELPLGSYQAQIEADGFLMRKVGFDILLNETSTPLIILTPKPDSPQAALGAKAITIKRQVLFVSNSAEIRGESDALLAEIADVLLRNPQVRRVEIQGHTDDLGTEAINQQLSQRRAEAVRSWLISAGLEPGRLSAVGYGRSRPLVPNITPANQARNRRVAFEILEQP